MASRVTEYPSYGHPIQSRPGSSTQSATNKVLDTPEILEMILARVDMRTLLTSAQRVCRRWVNLISQAPSIQKILFFTPIKDSEWGVGEKTINPLLTEAFPSIFPAKDTGKHHEVHFSDLTMNKDTSTMFRFVRKDASWRKMLVQQPPVSDIGLLNVSHGMMGDHVVSSTISADKKMQESGYHGIRMERLFELLLTLYFSDFITVQVYWSTGDLGSFKSSFENIRDEFHRIINKFGLVVYKQAVVQCSMGGYSPNATEMIKKEIITAYGEHGLDFICRRKNIEESQGEAISFQGERQHLVYIPRNPHGYETFLSTFTYPTSPSPATVE
ncbi:uncharacterized protein N7500_008302 [Penicillium coprophilum]|uniref:uncharacterized protein n=1 Tax=Penicillium coprophilum TaxID=36646 RepID=UPI0023897F16|nr:uncharacterized protein N7500_008302 [Penicillium coprophilum]KAJ5158651.1 hypothetical protein N7500_008302 [Penicillium coprophilum]